MLYRTRVVLGKWSVMNCMHVTQHVTGAQGIVNMHAAGWAHMDLKPDNLCFEMKHGQAHPYIIDYRSCIEEG